MSNNPELSTHKSSSCLPFIQRLIRREKKPQLNRVQPDNLVKKVQSLPITDSKSKQPFEKHQPLHNLGDSLSWQGEVRYYSYQESLNKSYQGTSSYQYSEIESFKLAPSEDDQSNCGAEFQDDEKSSSTEHSISIKKQDLIDKSFNASKINIKEELSKLIQSIYQDDDDLKLPRWEKAIIQKNDFDAALKLQCNTDSFDDSEIQIEENEDGSLMICAASKFNQSFIRPSTDNLNNQYHEGLSSLLDIIQLAQSPKKQGSEANQQKNIQQENNFRKPKGRYQTDIQLKKIQEDSDWRPWRK